MASSINDVTKNWTFWLPLPLVTKFVGFCVKRFSYCIHFRFPRKREIKKILVEKISKKTEFPIKILLKLIFFPTGGFPYPTVSNHELLPYLRSGRRLERPDNCSEFLYELMLECWNEHPEARPSFKQIVSRLDPNKSKIYIDFDELSPTYVFPPTCEEHKNTLLKKGSPAV